MADTQAGAPSRRFPVDLSATASDAFRFVLILGVVNLFADTTYEGASSINGPFLGSLGANAAAIGIIAGLGEFLGYSLRAVAGYVADRTGRYWPITFVGYAINLLAVPALALAGAWPVAAILVVAERVGRAIRKPTVEAMLSYTTGTLGKGGAYAIHNALDQTGAVIGPLVVAGVLALRLGFRTGYATLLVSALLALGTLVVARRFFPHPADLAAGPTAMAPGFSRAYWLYTAAGAFVAAGLLSFELIAFHFARTGVVTDGWIPLVFALAMAIDAISGLALGRLFDRRGMLAVGIAFGLSALYAPLVFLGSAPLVAAGIVLWGIGFGAQDALLKSVIASVLPEGRRNLAFGLFYVGYGAGWLIGSSVTGVLYAGSLIAAVAAFSVVVQLVALPLFWAGSRAASPRRSAT